MRRLCCTAQFVAALALAGCGTVEVFGRYDLPEGPGVAAAPWPRLIDTPATPAPGSYTVAAPDPTRGVRVRESLDAEAAVAAVRAGELAAPIMTETERAELSRRARRRR